MNESIKVRLVLEVTYNPNGMSASELEALVCEIPYHAANNGMMSGSTDAEVESWEVNVSSSKVLNENLTEILQHQISWFLRGEGAPKELDECSIEHISKCIKEGCNQGELCVLGEDGNTEFRGWWSIKKS